MRFLFLFVSALVLTFSVSGQQTQYISPQDPAVLWNGRIDRSMPGEVRFSYPGVSAKIRFEGRICRILLDNNCGKGFDTLGNHYYVILDNKAPVRIAMTDYDHVYKVKGLEPGTHTVELVKLTESLVGEGVLRGFEIEKGKKLLPVEEKPRKIEFIGNSITCGYGNEGSSPDCHFSPATENNYLAYSAITARNLNADYMIVAYSGKGVIRNYDPEGETLPQFYDQVFPHRKKPLWNFVNWIPDAVVINLGTNDFAHEIPDSALFVKTYLDLLIKIRNNYPKARIYCIEGSMIRDGWPEGIPSLTLVKRYIEATVNEFRKEKDKEVHTFYLSTCQEGDFGCDYHPNLKRHQIMAEELTTFIKKTTGW